FTTDCRGEYLELNCICPKGKAESPRLNEMILVKRTPRHNDTVLISLDQHGDKPGDVNDMIVDTKEFERNNEDGRSKLTILLINLTVKDSANYMCTIMAPNAQVERIYPEKLITAEGPLDSSLMTIIVIVVSVSVAFIIVVATFCFVRARRRRRRSYYNEAKLETNDNGYGAGQRLTDHNDSLSDGDTTTDADAIHLPTRQPASAVNQQRQNKTTLSHVPGRKAQAGDRPCGDTRAQRDQRLGGDPEGEAHRGRSRERQRRRRRQREQEGDSEWRGSWPRNPASRQFLVRHASRERLWTRDQGPASHGRRPSTPGFARGYRSDVALDHDERSWAREPFGEYPYHVRHTSAYPDGPTPYHPVQYPMDRESHLARGGRYMSAPRLWLSHYPEDPVYHQYPADPRQYYHPYFYPHHPYHQPHYPRQRGTPGDVMSRSAEDVLSDHPATSPRSPGARVDFAGPEFEAVLPDHYPAPSLPPSSPQGPGHHSQVPNLLSRESVPPPRVPTALNVPVHDHRRDRRDRTPADVATSSRRDGAAAKAEGDARERTRVRGRHGREPGAPGTAGEGSSEDPQSTGEDSPLLRQRSHSNSLSSDSDNAMSAARGRQTHGAPSGDERTPEVDIRDIKTDNETRRKRPVLSAATCARKESVRRLPVVCAADMAVHRGNESRRSRGEKHKMGCACEICKANRPCRGGARVGAASDRVEGDVVLETRMGPNDREIPPGETVETDPHRVELRRGEGSDRRGDSEGRVSSGHSAGIEQMGVLLNPTSDTSVVNSENQHCSSFTENGHSTSPKAPHGPRGQ
ncbi:hypothetical protein BaRGS_00008388, partial [Batillaria attramentaria]